MKNPITEAEYAMAIAQEKAAKEIIVAYERQKADDFQKRLESGVPFTDEELIYAAWNLCPCGHGMAYPKGCGAFHYWDCAGVLKGIAEKEAVHCGQHPFTMYNIKSENQPSANGQTTRGVFQPKPTTRNPLPA